ncbi:toprim domain-containing protein [Pedobacter sp. Hv1]|uniref:toprim domain-containing protein n=1 Tax=Pedobacter sp. Hv1 TaxID=1740090 RepID=UPI0009EA719E|nr:toprim domain-containing protein [Pedobacter sp. Hv1]
MSKFIAVADLQELSIVDFLARLGHQSVKKTGKEHFYHSMLRETKRDTPSFTVWDNGGKWLDRGGAGDTNIKGGGIVQLGMALWPNLPFVEVLQKIQQVSELDTALIPEYLPQKEYPFQKEEDTYKYEVVRVQEAGDNFILARYLESRGVKEVATGRLNTIYYCNKHDPEDQRTFYALGWKNEHQGWELATSNGFKSSIGPKGISIIPGLAGHIAMFEGYMDYLSWLKLNPAQIMPTVIVLNSISMLSRAIEWAANIPKIDIYFDNDGPGMRSAQELMARLPQATDRSNEYTGYKDYNDKLVAELKEATLAIDRPSQEEPTLATNRKR